MSDVRQSFVAIGEDLGVQARVVVFLVDTPPLGPHLRFTAQVCNSAGAPLPDVPSHARPWPDPSHKTLAQMLLHILERLYDTVEYYQEQATLPPEARHKRP